MKLVNRILTILLISLSTVFTGSCGNMDTRPKSFGSTLNILPDDSANQENFRFLFAYRDDDDATSANKLVVQLQGADNATSAIINTCNSAGTGCYCDFYDSSNTLLETASGTSGISYSSTNNTISCLIGNIAHEDTVDNVILRNSDSSIVSDRVTVSTSLTLSQVLHGLSVDSMRTVYRYKCMRTFLQKAATVYPDFDCTDQGLNDLSFLHADFNYFVYGSNSTNNYSDQLVDVLYNGSSGGSVCNMQVKQYDCVNTITTNGGLLDKVFAIYGSQKGPFSREIDLNANPSKPNTPFGYAAPPQEFPAGSGVFICPPGMKRFDTFTTQIDRDDFLITSNMPDKDSLSSMEILDATDTDVWPVSTTSPSPTAIDVETRINGDCDATNTFCTDPAAAKAATGVTYSYTAAGSQFCAIPADLLP